MYANGIKAKTSYTFDYGKSFMCRCDDYYYLKNRKKKLQNTRMKKIVKRKDLTQNCVMCE